MNDNPSPLNKVAHEMREDQLEDYQQEGITVNASVHVLAKDDEKSIIFGSHHPGDSEEDAIVNLFNTLNLMRQMIHQKMDMLETHLGYDPRKPPEDEGES